MIGDTFEFNGKNYTIKKDVSFGDHRKITKIQLDIKNATPENESELSNKFNEIMLDFLESVLGLTQEDVDKLSLLEAAELFGKAFLVAVSIKKKLETTSESQS